MPYKDLLNGTLYTTLACMIPTLLVMFMLTYIFTIIQKDLRDKAWARRLRILLMYDIAAIFVIYPIADRNHFAIGTICTLITSAYLLYELIKYSLKLLKKDKIIFAMKTFFEAAGILLMLAFIAKSTITLTKYMQDIENQTYLNYFKYIPTDEYLQKRINNVDKYILAQKEEGKETYILDTMAAAFIIPTGEYHKNYDMFNLGNFGSRGEPGIIEDLKNEENIIVLVINDNQRKNWQLPTKVVEYVKDEFTKIGSIDVFDIYKK